MRFGSQSIARIRAGASTGNDQYGDPIPGVSSELVVNGCSVEPGSGTEFDDRREATTTLYTALAPPSDVMETDLIRYDGTVYAVDGPVGRWRGVGSKSHDVIRLKAVAG